MKKPDGVECWHCRWWYWYGGSCSVHTYDEDLGIDPMSPSSIDCDSFEIKIMSEHGAEHYDSLPSLEIIEIAWRSRQDEYAALIGEVS